MTWQHRRYEMTVSTADATKTLIGSVTPVDGTVVHVCASVAGRKDNGTQGFSAELRGTFRRAGAATTQIGSTTALHMEGDDAAWIAEFSITGAAIEVYVTGNAGDTVAWRAWVTTQEVPAI